MCERVLHRCDLPLHPAALPLPLPPPEAGGLQRAAAALLPARPPPGACSQRPAHRTGQLTAAHGNTIQKYTGRTQKAEIDSFE